MLLNNRFHVIDSLGAGEFSETFFAKDTHMPSRRLCVVKYLHLDSQSKSHQTVASEQFQKEATTLQKLAHDQIPDLYGYFQEDHQHYLVQEWVDGQTLGAKVKRTLNLSAKETYRVLVELLPILTYIHEQGIIHCNIKPENIILRIKDNKPVLIGFGLINQTPQVETKTTEISSSADAYSPGFAPPEQVTGSSIHASSDVYALGMVAIYALTGKLPRDMDSEPLTSQLPWRKHLPFINEKFAAILDKATQVSPDDRYQSAAAMQQDLLALESDAGQVPLSPKVASAATAVSAVRKPWWLFAWGAAAAIALVSVSVRAIGVQMGALRVAVEDIPEVEAPPRATAVVSADVAVAEVSGLTDDDAQARLLDVQKLVGEASNLEAVKDRGATEKFRAAAADLLSIPAGTSAYGQATSILADILSMEISRTTAAVEELKIDSQLSPLNLTKRSLKASDWTGNKKNMYDPQAPVVTRFGDSTIQGYERRDTWKTHQKPGGPLEGGRHFQAVWANDHDIWIEDYTVVPEQLHMTVVYGCMTQSIIQLEGYFNQELGMEFMDATLKAWLNDANAVGARQALQAVYNSTDIRESTFEAGELVGMVQRTDDGKIMVLVRG
ncbi:MAG: serine/threonine-protein kinase [Cyanobacteria bacterium P01_D01_bin.156]